MTKLIRACLLALPLFIAPSSAHAWCFLPSCGVSHGGRCDHGGCGGCGCALALPWYTYWPYEAHFQTPAPYAAYPYWPPAAVTGEGYEVPATPAPAQLPPPQAGDISATGYQPAGYSGQAPSYWYGR